MKRVVLASILAVAALSLLVVFALQSRSVPVAAHVAQHTIVTEIEDVQADFAALVLALETALEQTRPPDDSAVVSEQRLARSPSRLTAELERIPGSATEIARMENSLESFSRILATADALARDLIENQTTYAESTAFLRDDGPPIIQRVRDTGLERLATDTFQLIVGTVDFASSDSSISEDDLRQLHTTLLRDQQLAAAMPAETEALLDAALTILDSKHIIASQVAQLADTPVPASAANLALAVNDAYGSAVAAADSARTMLTVYAIVLLFAVGLAGFRLQLSNTEINRANSELAALNESLEQRVEERTRELTDALSELRESQVQLVQAEKMSSLGQLVAGISHEINTPLLYLANNADLVKERIELLHDFVKKSATAFSIDKSGFADHAEYQKKLIGALRELRSVLTEGELDAAVDEALDLMNDSIEGLRDLTEMAQGLKDFSRLDRAPVGSFDVNSGIEKTLMIARNMVKHKAHVHKFFSDLPEIQCSPSKINQVFLNLITNAAQAIEDQGEIVIKTALHDHDHVAISISDTGCGISEENLGRVRDPFFTTKEVGTGTGLGLSIVDEIVRSHGGELKIESRVGQGSVFTVILPVEQRVAEPAASTAASPNQQSDADAADGGHAPEDARPLAEAV